MTDFAEKELSSSIVDRTEKAFVERCIAFKIDYGTPKFFGMQSCFFMGAMIAVNLYYKPWVDGIERRTAIVDKYEIKNEE